MTAPSRARTDATERARARPRPDCGELSDALVLFDAAETVEQSNPDLVGGLSAYKANSAHGPFVHVDVRGRRARW